MNRFGLSWRVLPLVLAIFALESCGRHSEVKSYPLSVAQPDSSSPSPDCDQFMATLPADWSRGWLTVPKNWNDPSSKETFEIFYYGNWKAHPDSTPFVFFNGGPGGNSWSLSTKWQSHPESKDFSVIFFDQRGNGCSTLYPATLPQTQQEARDLALFGETSILKDVEALRAQLWGAKKWNIFGQSYGSLLVHRYVEEYPDAVAHAFAHGWAPINDPNDYRRLYREHYAVGADTYFKNHPDLAKALSDVFKRQTASLCAAKGPCAYTVIPDEWVSLFPLPEKDAELTDSIGKLLVLAKTSTVVKPVAPVTPDSEEVFPADVAGEVIARYDYRNASFTPEDNYGCGIGMESLTKEWGKTPGTSLVLSTGFFQCEPVWTTMVPYAQWVIGPKPTKPLLAPFVESLEKHPAIQFFLYSGREDELSPATYFHDEVAALGKRITFRTFTGDHHAWFDNAALWADLKASQ